MLMECMNCWMCNPRFNDIPIHLKAEYGLIRLKADADLLKSNLLT